jgi:hypothetical protein
VSIEKAAKMLAEEPLGKGAFYPAGQAGRALP